MDSGNPNRRSIRVSVNDVLSVTALGVREKPYRVTDDGLALVYLSGLNPTTLSPTALQTGDRFLTWVERAGFQERGH
jgi:hypothetical protein